MENLGEKDNKIYSKTFQELEKALKGLKQKSYQQHKLQSVH